MKLIETLSEKADEAQGCDELILIERVMRTIDNSVEVVDNNNE